MMQKIMKLKFSTEKLFVVILLLLVSTKAISQIDPGVDFDLNGYINSRLDAGEITVVVPPGRYRVPRSGNTHLKFTNRNNVTIIADGVEMVCTETVQAIQIQDCNNFKLQGLSVDYDPLPFTQGEIAAISADKRTLTVDLIDGYSSTVIGDKVEIYDPVTGELSARTYYGSTYVVDTQARRVIVTKGDPLVNFAEKVGDIVVIGSRGTTNIPHTITPSRCTNLILENVIIYSGTTFAFFETNCKGSKYINCSVDRRPLETEIRSRGIKRMRSNNADAFHSKFAEIGPSYVGCVARYNGDDSFAINGNFHIISETNGNVLTVIAKGGGNNTTDFVVGEVVELISYSGERMPDATITQIQTGRALNAQEINFLQTQTFSGQADNTYTASNVYSITIDRSIDLPLGSLINSATRSGNGFEVRNCIAGPNRSRGILVKASNGIITGNTCVGNWGQAIKCSPEYSWLEAGSGNNLVISNNVISGCHDVAIAVYANGGNGSTSPIGAHNNIQIIGNQISGSSNPNIAVTSTSNLCMMDNTISSPNNDLLLPWYENTFGSNEDPNRTIYLENVSEIDCNNLVVTGVTVTPETATLATEETLQLTANIIPSVATNQSVTWSSSNPSIASVDPNSGLVTAVAEGGPVTITATTSDGGFMDTSIITVDGTGSSESQTDDDGDGVMNDKDNCPNTPSNVNIDVNGCPVFVLPSNNFAIEVQSETCPNKNNGKIIIEASETYNYVATINGNNYNFNDNKLSVEDLQPGAYTACISVEGETFEQCFNLTINEVKTISGKATVNSKKTSIEITQGTAPFKVFINGKKQFEISSKSFDLEVNHGDFIQVKTAVDCEGVYSKTIDLFKEINVYPNPTNDFTQVNIPNGSFSNVQFKLYDLLGKLVFGEQVDPGKGKWQIGVSGLAKGIYFLKITADDQVVHHKIIKK